MPLPVLFDGLHELLQLCVIEGMVLGVDSFLGERHILCGIFTMRWRSTATPIA